jgi:hypothetical protein
MVLRSSVLVSGKACWSKILVAYQDFEIEAALDLGLLNGPADQKMGIGR